MDRPQLADANPLSRDELRPIDAWRRAANYLSIGQIYLLDNPLLKEPLSPVHIKPPLLGPWGTTPGQNFLYVHQPGHQSTRPRHDLHIRPGAWRSRLGREHLARRDLQRNLPACPAKRALHAALVQAVQLSGRYRESRRAGNPGPHLRGRRAWLFAVATPLVRRSTIPS